MSQCKSTRAYMSQCEPTRANTSQKESTRVRASQCELTRAYTSQCEPARAKHRLILVALELGLPSALEPTSLKLTNWRRRFCPNNNIVSTNYISLYIYMTSDVTFTSKFDRQKTYNLPEIMKDSSCKVCKRSLQFLVMILDTNRGFSMAELTCLCSSQ